MRQNIAASTLFAMILSGIVLFNSTLRAQVPVFFTNTFDTPPTLAITQTVGAWYPDRYPPTIFEQYNFNGENVLHVGIRLTDARLNRPLADQDQFHNTQGRTFSLGRGNSHKTALLADLYVGADWNTKHRMATLWSSACDSTGAISAYNILGFRNATGSDPGFYTYSDAIGAWVLLPFPITYGQWYSLRIELTDTAFVYSINGTAVLSDTALMATKFFNSLILEAYNFADSTSLPPVNQSFEDYDVYWDNVGAVPLPVHLRTAGNFRILAGSAVTIGSGTTVAGDIGVSPTPTLTNSGTVTGAIHLNDAAAIQAQLDLSSAYDDAAGRTADSTVGTELGGTTLTSGVYVSAAGTFGITGTLTLNGTASDIFIFRMASTLTTGVGSAVTLAGGVLASNVFWQVGSSATIDGNFKGNILALTSITQNVGGSIGGRALAQNGFVTLNGPSVSAVELAVPTAPKGFALAQNYPNPFNPSTRIEYNLEQATQVSLKVYSLLGLEVATLVNSRQEAGSYTVVFNSNEGKASLSSGVYFYRLEAGSFVLTRRLLLLK